jgi:hypothetical protein
MFWSFNGNYALHRARLHRPIVRMRSYRARFSEDTCNPHGVMSSRNMCNVIEGFSLTWREGVAGMTKEMGYLSLGPFASIDLVSAVMSSLVKPFDDNKGHSIYYEVDTCLATDYRVPSGGILAAGGIWTCLPYDGWI